MVFDLDEDIYDDTKIEETEVNCPWTISVPSGASHDFMITKLRWSFQHPFWLTANIYLIDKPSHPIILDIKRETLAFAKLFITLTVYKKYTEPHLTQHDLHILRELLDTAEFHMGTHTGYYKRNKEDTTEPIQLQVIIFGGARTQSLQLVVPPFVLYN